MLAIRTQRTGRSGQAQFRVIVQDSRFSPTSGRVVAYLGSYNPHTKETTLDGEKLGQYLANGAQPSDRVASLMKKQGIKLPAWFKQSAPKKGAIKNPEKRRSTNPNPVAKAEPPAASAGQVSAEAPVEEQLPAEIETTPAEGVEAAPKPDAKPAPATPAASKDGTTPEAEVEPETSKKPAKKPEVTMPETPDEPETTAESETPLAAKK